MVEGHDLVGGGDELGVDGAPDGLRHNGRPGAARQLLRGLLHRLAVRLAHLHRPGTHTVKVWSISLMCFPHAHTFHFHSTAYFGFDSISL